MQEEEPVPVDAIAVSTNRPLEPSFTVSRVLKIVALILLLAILTAPAFVGYFGRFTISQLRILAFSVYGIYSLINFVLQVIFASVNRWRMHKQETPIDRTLRVGILVVGYREDPFMFRKCLESLNTLGPLVVRRVCVIDGNSAEDAGGMAAIGEAVFQTQTIALDYLPGDDDDNRKELNFPRDTNVCVTQPHKGKRYAMFTGFKILLEDDGVDAIVTIDSDTIVDSDAVENLTRPMLLDDEIGAVAGEINVWNTDTMLSFLTSLRYWFAFNMERASSSLLRCVMCVGGPLGCYRSSTLRLVIDKWLHQTFLGKPCTFGDDRHLTNCILGTGMRVVYTQRAKCQTDSPTDLVSFMNQQTRWSKSYFREIFYSLACLDRQNFWLGWELFYRTFYFFLVSFWAMYLLYFATIKTQAIAILVMTAFGILRTIFGLIIMRDARFLFFTLYGYVYFFVIVPTKITALFTMRETGWGTRGTFAGTLKRYVPVIVAIVWLCAVLGGCAFTIYKNYSFRWTDWNYRFAFITLMAYLAFEISCIASYVVLQQCGFLSNPTQKWLKRQRQTEELIESKGADWDSSSYPI